MTHANIKIPLKEYRLVKKIAKKKGCFILRVLIEAIREYAEKEENKA